MDAIRSNVTLEFSMFYLTVFCVVPVGLHARALALSLSGSELLYSYEFRTQDYIIERVVSSFFKQLFSEYVLCLGTLC